MKNCPKCGRPVEDGPVCQSCGYALPAVANLESDSSAVRINSPTIDKSPKPPKSVAAGAARPRRSRFSPMAIGITAAGIAALTLLASAMRSPATPPPVQTALASNHVPAAAPTAAPAIISVPPASISVSRWSATELTRRGHGTYGIMFELAADETIAVWRKRVRPVLTIQCAANTAEIFVMTDSAASFENTGRHTVLVGFDDGDAIEQIWDHSLNHDALFAPAGNVLLNQIASARRMSFTFTPFNASPAIVNFSVAGFDAQLARAAKRCGLKP
jgi:hypothetical protein